MSTPAIPLADRLIFALDMPDPATAREWVLRLEPRVNFFKVGLQLFLAGGFPIVDWIKGRGHRVMLDLKLYDIPETVRLAVEQAVDHQPDLLTVHGDHAIMRAAAEASGNTGILAVTVLTSLSQADLADLGWSRDIAELVCDRAHQAMESGCAGVVCSGWEAARVRQVAGPRCVIVTPGIRPGGEQRVDDQKRVVTAAAAIAAGASHLVVGRPISQAADPLAVVAGLQDEISLALVNSRV